MIFVPFPFVIAEMGDLLLGVRQFGFFPTLGLYLLPVFSDFSLLPRSEEWR